MQFQKKKGLGGFGQCSQLCDIFQGWTTHSINNNHLFHPHLDYDEQQVAERSEEKRCEAEEKVEEAGGGGKKY